MLSHLIALAAGTLAQGGVETSQEQRTAPDVGVGQTLVTARKWAEPLEDVPSSVTVVSGGEIESAGMRTVRDASVLVPNLHLTEFSSRRLSFPFLRGVGSGQGEPAVVTYIDGVPQLSTGSTNLPLVDVDRIEFLRGPQGALYGRNSLGGVIHVITERPSSTPRGEVGLTLGDHGLREVSASWSGPIADEGAFLSLSLLDSSRDGYTKNDFTGNEVDERDGFFGRAQVLLTPDESSEVRISLYGERSRDGGFVLSDLGGLKRDPHRINQNFEGVAERDLLAPSVTWNRFGDGVDFTSITAFTDSEVLETSDFDFSAFDAVRRRTKEEQEYVSQELRLSSSEGSSLEVAGGDLRWLAGVHAYMSDSDSLAQNDFRVPLPAIGVDTNTGDFEDFGVGLFGQATLTLSEDFDLTAGARLDHESKEVDLRHTFETGGFTVLDVSSDEDEDFSELLPMVSAAWRVSEAAMLYAQAAKGYKAGGFNLTAPAGSTTFDEEQNWTYEVGVKASTEDGRVNARAALYYVDWDQMQLSLFDPAAGGYVDNAGESTSHGIEIEVDARVLEGVSVFAVVGTAETEFDEYTDPYGNDVSGNELSFAPEATWSFGVHLDGDLPHDTTWFARGEYVGVGDFYYDANNTQSESYELINLRAGVQRKGWRLTAWVRNAADAEYFPVAFQPDPTDPTVFVAESGEPRTAGITLSASF